MAAIMIAGVYSGLKLDEWVAWQIPVFTLVLTMLSSVLAIYVIIKDV